MLCKILTFTILEAKVDVVGSLEGEVETDYIRMLNLFKNVYLGYYKFGLLT